MQNILFADANSDYKTARYVICGVPFDGTSSFRTGSRLAPQEMRAASYNFETYSSFFDIDLADVKIHDAGDLKVATTIDETLEMISVTAEKYFRESVLNAKKYGFNVERCHAEMLSSCLSGKITSVCYNKLGLKLSFDKLPFNLP